MVKTCFIISSIGEEGSQERILADEKFELVFSPILKKFEYKVTRADKIGTPGSISREIISNVINSDLVIADVSDGNPNVFYELATRNAVKKPVIVFRKINQTMPFDVYDTRAIDIDRSQPRIWDSAKINLELHIKESEKHPEKASESILSNFTFQINPTKLSGSDETNFILKDLQQQLRGISKEVRHDEITIEKNKIKSKELIEFNRLMQKIIDLKPELSISEIMAQIKEKKEKIGAGYLTDQGALFLIASDYGVTLSDSY